MFHLGYASTRLATAFSTHADRNLDAFFAKNSVHGYREVMLIFLESKNFVIEFGSRALSV